MARTKDGLCIQQWSPAKSQQDSGAVLQPEGNDFCLQPKRIKVDLFLVQPADEDTIGEQRDFCFTRSRVHDQSKNVRW